MSINHPIQSTHAELAGNYLDDFIQTLVKFSENHRLVSAWGDESGTLNQAVNALKFSNAASAAIYLSQAAEQAAQPVMHISTRTIPAQTERCRIALAVSVAQALISTDTPVEPFDLDWLDSLAIHSPGAPT